jgi:hypothetical protein
MVAATAAETAVPAHARRRIPIRASGTDTAFVISDLLPWMFVETDPFALMLSERRAPYVWLPDVLLYDKWR